MTGAVWLVVLPLLGAFILPLVYRRHAAAGSWTAPLLLLISFSVALGLWYGLAQVGPQSVDMGGFAAPLGIVFYSDRLAVLFAMLLILGTLVLWLGHPGKQVREETLVLLLVGAGSGLLLSGDLFNMYVFYEIVAVASYGLAASRGTGAGYAAGLRYLLLGALGSSLILLGIAIIYALTGTLNLSHLAGLAAAMLHNPAGLAAFALIVVGYGVKAELFPVNTWVPEVYAAAPVRVSALLAGIVSKLAMLAILRVLLVLYGDTPAHMLLLGLGVLGVISGELAALRATDLRHVLAYSSIGQLGLVAVAFAIPGPAGVLAGIALALHHAVVKPALFMLLHAWGGPIARLAGAARNARLAVVLFVVLALSLIGVPPLPGFWAKFLLLKAALGADNAWAAAVVLLASVIETAYFLRIARVMHADREPLAPPPARQELRPALAFGAALLLAVFGVGMLGDSLQGVAEQASDIRLYVQRTLPVWQLD